MGIVVHPRVHERHPDLDEQDVTAAWNTTLASIPRLDKDPREYAAIGVNGKGRPVEMVAKRTSEGIWLIYRARTPPTSKMRKELSKAWRRHG